MFYITKNNFFQYQSVLNSRKNLAENKGIPKNKKPMTAEPRNLLKNQINVMDKSRVLKRSLLIIILLISLILKNEMLPKNSLLETSVLCSSSYTKLNIISPLLISSNSSTSFLNMKKNNIIHKRSMMSRRVIARSMNSLNNVPMITRGYACVHGGYLKKHVKKPPVNDTDFSHQQVYKTICAEKECKKVNCADSSAQPICPGRTTSQNKQSIPDTSKGFITTLEGNFTSKAPVGKKKVVVDPHINYDGDPKPQEMVKETAKVTVNSSDVKVNKKGTKYAQQQDHHDEITK